MRKKITPYRLKVVQPRSCHGDGYTTYIVRDAAGRVSYIGGDETPLALSNLVRGEAATLRFALEDCLRDTDAKSHVVAAWHRASPNADKQAHVRVEVLN